MLGIIRVLTTEDDSILNEHSLYMKDCFGIESEADCIPDQWNGIYDDQSEAMAEPKIVTLAKEMEAQGKFKAITISCAADPALALVRGAVSLPVFGAGECGSHAASMVGDQVGVIGITEEAPSNLIDLLGRNYHSYAFSKTLRKTTDLFEKDAKEKLGLLVEEMVENGANVILFACTGFSTIRLKEFLGNVVNDVPIIDLVEAQAIAYQIIDGGGRG